MRKWEGMRMRMRMRSVEGEMTKQEAKEPYILVESSKLWLRSLGSGVPQTLIEAGNDEIARQKNKQRFQIVTDLCLIEFEEDTLQRLLMMCPKIARQKNNQGFKTRQVVVDEIRKGSCSPFDLLCAHRASPCGQVSPRYGGVLAGCRYALDYFCFTVL
ncbi:uncharacterized protein LOC126595586 isoform X4 [Malus sylvestris]|uniref:uncharacterized protein LOC126595586 isoform X4 n=1 Tax=Malus sylvestris TaxID=3752 RepID=UPI0021AC5A8B|nr:uncharacterized protein LOC126595586 isoform X4 [Malus sylvestris]